MEKQKKKISKKAVVICSIVLAVLLIVGGVFTYKYVTRERLYTFDEITNGLSEQVSYVVDADGVLTQGEIDEKCERYNRVDFVKVDENEINAWHGYSMGGELMSHLLFYDKSNNVLFEINEFRYAFVLVYVDGVLNDYQMTNL